MKYYLSSASHVTGPYTREELMGSLSGGMIPGDAMICEEGTEDWHPFSSLTAKADGEVSTRADIVPATPFTGLDVSEKQQVNVYNYYHPKTPGVAIILEVLPGIFLQTFGIGNLYAGNIVTGLVLMLTYWATLVVNIVLTVFLIGLVTWPLTFLTFLIIGIITANNAANRANYERVFQARVG